MDSITQIYDSLNSFSKTCFKFTSFLEVLLLLKKFPDSISSKLYDEDFIYHLSHANSHVLWLNDYLEKNVNKPVKKILTKSSSKDKEQPYADFTVDKPPVFKQKLHEQITIDQILKKHLDSGKPLKPVKHRSSGSVPDHICCPYCNASKDYIYNNNKHGQYLCKACKNTFSIRITYSDALYPCCPYCERKLELHHDRSNYIVYVCMNKKCSFYLKNKKKIGTDEEVKITTSSGNVLLRYHYRDFKFDLEDLKKACESADTTVNLSKIHYSDKVLGLILTYYVNYGLSARKTASILSDVHGIRISHQTVINYANSVSALIKPLIDNYPYKLRSILTGDETYIKIRGKNYYVFFFSDTTNKIITYYKIYKNRDTKAACEAIYQSSRFYDPLPDDFTIITDGNPIYNAAQLFFSLNGIDFTLHQVIGVKNKDEESKEYRPFKQIEERLNRTYKQNYYGTNGYDKLEGANSYMVLFVSFYNFLRKNTSLGYKTPVDDHLFDDNMLMQDKWLKLIELSEQYHLA